MGTQWLFHWWARSAGAAGLAVMSDERLSTAAVAFAHVPSATLARAARSQLRRPRSAPAAAASSQAPR